MLLSKLKKIFSRAEDERKQVMYVIIGLGNPGNRYRFTRHNIGFMVLEEIAARWKVDLKQKSFNALWNRGKVADQEVILALPQTYMNLSGNAARDLMAYFKVAVSHLIVIHDDLDLPFGSVRLKTGGGNAGHKGLKSISECLGSKDFMRIRLGIDKPADKSCTEGYVLEKFRKEEAEHLSYIIQLAADAASELITSSMQQAMVKYHTKNISI